MGVCETDELDRLSKMPIEDLGDIKSLRRKAKCHDCGRITDEDDICSNDVGDECCDCGSTRIKWFEE